MQQDSELAHRIRVTNVHRFGDAPDPRSHGEIVWSPRDGVTFRLEFPLSWKQGVLESRSSAGESKGGSGSMHSIVFEPEWLANTPEGEPVRLFGTIVETKTILTTTNGAQSSRRIVFGTAAYADVVLHKDNPTASWNDTPPLTRMFFLGLRMLPWPQEESITFSIGDTEHRRSRQSLALSDDSSLAWFRAESLPDGFEGAWLTYPLQEGHPFWYPVPCEVARSLASFLVGQWTPFLWRDTYLDDNKLLRLYFGWHKNYHPPVGSEQPVPLGKGIEALRHGRDVASRLPRLFTRFSECRESYNLEWILSPLWTAASTFVDDQLSLACVSLERLSTAYDSWRKTDGANEKQKPLLTPEQQAAIAEATKPVVADTASMLGLKNDVVLILNKKIDNFHQATNADKLSQVFTELGIDLTDAEQKVLKDRNRCLHGRSNLTDANDTQAVADEVRRFDLLRTLLYRAVLSILNYDGPYVDYGARPDRGNFPIRVLSPRVAETIVPS